MKRTQMTVLVSLLLCFSFLLPNVAEAQSGERIIVLDFLALDEEGNYIDTLALKQADLVNLSRIMSQGIVSRLVQYGEFEVQDNASMRREIDSLGFTTDLSAWERARLIFQNNLADQVITGSITLLQTTAVLGMQRFQLVNGEPALVGSAMGTVPKVADAPTLVDNLMSSLFPSDVQVIERAIEQVFAVPGQMRLNLGAKQQLTVYALDSLGRPIANPQFLFFSSDESKVAVDENGLVTGLQPGSATITVRAISQSARSGSPATMNVTVVSPAFGVRLGTLVTQRSNVEGRPLRLGVRLTPTMDKRDQKAVTTAPATPEPTNPLSLVSSFFSSLLTDGLVTIDLDFDPTKELLVAFSGVQRSASGYIGTGVGYLSPLENLASEKGFIFRFTMGTQYRPSGRLAIPVEAVLDAIFPSGSTFSPSLRVGINIGFDLFP